MSILSPTSLNPDQLDTCAGSLLGCMLRISCRASSEHSDIEESDLVPMDNVEKEGAAGEPTSLQSTASMIVNDS